MRIKGLLACGVLVAASFTPAGAAPKVVVDIELYRFSQPQVTLVLGQAIQWRNLEAGPVPLDPSHNIIEDAYIPAGETVPIFTTKRICAAFEPGDSCQPSATQLPALLPRGRHFLTCTIDNDHTILMHMVVDVT